MAFTAGAFSPTDGLANTTTYVTTPTSETAARAQIQTVIGQVMTALNALITELEATGVGTSGADYIGSGLISGVSGTTVRDQLSDLKAQIDALSIGSVSDGTITDAKLATDVKVGSLASLTTSVSSSIQAAINELDAENGDLSAMTTTATTLAGAINEINASGWVTETKIGTGAVTSGKVGANAISAVHVSPGHVVGAKFGRIASTTQSIPHETNTAINWTKWDYDPDTSKSVTYASRMVCKYSGYYTITALAQMDGGSGVRIYRMQIKKNGSTILGETYEETDDPSDLRLDFRLRLTLDLVSLAVNDYIEVYLYHSGASAAENLEAVGGYTPQLTMRRNMF